MENMPSVEELMAFYRTNQAYVDLIVQNAAANNPQTRALRQQVEFNRQMEDFISEFPDSSLRSPEDFLALDNASEFLSYVGRGLSLAQAYKLCNYDALLERAGASGKKAGIEQAKSKSRMKSSSANMTGVSGAVPEDVKEFYHALLGDWSDSQIAKHYSKGNQSK